MPRAICDAKNSEKNIISVWQIINRTWYQSCFAECAMLAATARGNAQKTEWMTYYDANGTRSRATTLDRPSSCGDLHIVRGTKRNNIACEEKEPFLLARHVLSPVAIFAVVRIATTLKIPPPNSPDFLLLCAFSPSLPTKTLPPSAIFSIQQTALNIASTELKLKGAF